MKINRVSITPSTRKMKKEIRILGIDDSPFNKFNPGERVLVLGTVFRGGISMDGLITTHITADGEDSTDKLVDMINNSRSKDQLSVVMLDGIALGGLNIVDINDVANRIGLPVLTVIRKKPDMKKMKLAIGKIRHPERRLSLIEKAGKIYTYTVSNKSLGGKTGEIFYQTAGLPPSEVEKIFKLTVQHGLLPEPIRIAHIIGAGLKNGESRGRA